MQTLEQRIEAIEAKLGIVVDAPQTSAPIKDWEIVAFKNHYGQIFIKKENGCFCHNWTEHQMINGHPKMAASIANGKLSIHSVKRLSDGLVATVGDMDKDGDVVTKFVIEGNNMKVCFFDEFMYCYIEDFNPFTPSFTFTTHDGVVITDPERVVYGLENEGVYYHKAHAKVAATTNRPYTWFSTLEALVKSRLNAQK